MISLIISNTFKKNLMIIKILITRPQLTTTPITITNETIDVTTDEEEIKGQNISSRTSTLSGSSTESKNTTEFSVVNSITESLFDENIIESLNNTTQKLKRKKNGKKKKKPQNSNITENSIKNSENLKDEAHKEGNNLNTNEILNQISSVKNVEKLSETALKDIFNKKLVENSVSTTVEPKKNEKKKRNKKRKLKRKEEKIQLNNENVTNSQSFKEETKDLLNGLLDRKGNELFFIPVVFMTLIGKIKLLIF
jgi:hypothetical protein